MVRTYGVQQKSYQLVSPWEQAMMNADHENGVVPIQTGKRMFNKNNVGKTSHEFQNTAKQSKLPPLKDEPTTVLSKYENEIGNILQRSPERLERIKIEMQLFDQNDTGNVSRSAVVDILKRFKIPKNEKNQKDIISCFVTPNNATQIARFDLIDYLENCRDTFLERKNNKGYSNEVRQITVDMPRKSYSDSTHGRYDSQATNEGNSNKTGKFGRGSKEMFVEKRDAGLILEIERAFKASHISDPHSLIDELAEKLDQTCRNDEQMSDNMHVKSLVDKSGFPLNSALTLKCIDRLDTQDMGRIEWPKFIEFLRKGAISFPRSDSRTANTSASAKSLTPNGQYKKIPNKYLNSNSAVQSPAKTPDTIPDKPAWEARTPLQNIQPRRTQKKRKNTDHEDNGPTFRPQETSTNRKSNSSNGRSNKQNNAKADETYLIDNASNDNLDVSYGDSEFDNSNIQMMDDDIEDAFIQYANQIRSKPAGNLSQHREHTSFDSDYSNGMSSLDNNEIPHGLDFSVMGERGECFKRVADAMKEKGRRTNDIITILDVERIVNYYNLLFDTNIPMEQVENVLNKYSSQGRIDVHRLIGAFGTEIQ